MVVKAKWILVLLGLGVGTSLLGQSFIQRLTNGSISVGQKVSRFQNGDLLIGDSSFESSTGDDTEAVFLTRMDPCGLVVWSKSYEKNGIQLLFTDFKINAQDDIFVFGSANDGIRSFLFLMRVDALGEKEDFIFFESDSPNHSSFSMDMRNDQILVWGSILKIGQPRSGFVAVFNSNFNVQWAKIISPFTFEGTVTFTAQDQILGRTGAFFYALDLQGNLQWSKNFDYNLNHTPIGGPHAVSGGYVFQALFQDKAFFFKINASGQLIWQSEQFGSSSFPAAIQELNGGEILAHYSAPDGVGNNLFQQKLTSSGSIQERMKLDTDAFFNVGSVSHAVRSDGFINVVGNRDALTDNSIERTDLLLQYQLNRNPLSCFQWIDDTNLEPNNYILTFPDFSTSIAPVNLDLRPQGGIMVNTLETPFNEVCSSAPKADTVLVDTTLSCKQNWKVTLPSDEFFWQDGLSSSQRTIKASGTLFALNDNCTNRIVYAYQLERGVCDCDVYLPNAFSPNGDGSNDILQLFSDCPIIALSTSVFDRWGNLIFQSERTEEPWNGEVVNGEARMGIYVVRVEYVLRTDSGDEQEGSYTNEVLLLR
ncbi:MAG: gliding motility-associated C-terminal domain-containing protein [Saprospiraceae bacterium]|nr:gliding motility-associated C-terminal domain-containing protein [Saprospiraceae bacterium]